jgi:hypothetical protein
MGAFVAGVLGRQTRGHGPRAVERFSPFSRKSVFFDMFRIWINYLPATFGDRKEQQSSFLRFLVKWVSGKCLFLLIIVLSTRF